MGVAAIRGGSPPRREDVGGRTFGMTRYGFNVRTRSGQRVDNIMIMEPSQADAERRLMQMYVQCEIGECRMQSVPRRLDTLDIEGVIGMIAAGTPSFQGPGAYYLVAKRRVIFGAPALGRVAEDVQADGGTLGHSYGLANSRHA